MNKEVPRCKNKACSIYINPFIKWTNGKRNWICNICNNENETLPHYLEKEIKVGTYEIAANIEYNMLI